MGPTISYVSSLFSLLPYKEYFGPEYSSEGEFTYLEVEAKRKAKVGKTKHISAYKTWLYHFKGKIR